MAGYKVIQLFNFPDLVIILGVLAKLREAAFGFFISICPSVFLQQLGFQYIFKRSGIRFFEICLNIFR
jgi:hypothetical protein